MNWLRIVPELTARAIHRAGAVVPLIEPQRAAYVVSAAVGIGPLRYAQFGGIWIRICGSGNVIGKKSVP